MAEFELQVPGRHILEMDGIDPEQIWERTVRRRIGDRDPLSTGLVELEDGRIHGPHDASSLIGDFYRTHSKGMFIVYKEGEVYRLKSFRDQVIGFELRDFGTIPKHNRRWIMESQNNGNWLKEIQTVLEQDSGYMKFSYEGKVEYAGWVARYLKEAKVRCTLEIQGNPRSMITDFIKVLERYANNRILPRPDEPKIQVRLV